MLNLKWENEINVLQSNLLLLKTKKYYIVSSFLYITFHWFALVYYWCFGLFTFTCILESFSDILMTCFPSSCVYFNNFFMFTLSSAAGPSTSSSSDDTLPKETDSPKCFKEKRKRPRSELTDFFREEAEKQDQKFKLFMDQMEKCRKRS